MSGKYEDHQRGEPHANDDPAEGSALESAQSHVARSPGTSCPGCVGCKAFSLAFGALLEWAEARELIHPESLFPICLRPPDASGNEHEVWFDDQTNRWFKSTYHNEFGLAWGREGTATALEYLTRLVLQNKYFRDDILLVALLNSGEQLRVLTSQPHISGESATIVEIQQWFESLGFIRLVCDDRIAWYRKPENLLVADAHEGNIIKTQTADLVPIDLNIVQPNGQMLQWVLNQCVETDSGH